MVIDLYWRTSAIQFLEIYKVESHSSIKFEIADFYTLNTII